MTPASPDRTTDEYRLYVVLDIVQSEIRYTEKRLAWLKTQEAMRLTEIANDRERRERAEAQRTQVAES